MQVFDVSPPPRQYKWSDTDLPAEYWWINFGPFRDRFSMDYAAIFASANDTCKAFVALATDREYYDLKDPRWGQLFDVMISTSQPAANPAIPGSGPMTAAKRDAILNTHTTDYERHIKGLPQPTV